MAWSVLQEKSSSGGSLNATVTFTAANLSAGTKIIVWITVDASASPQTAVTSVKDGALNTWTLVAGPVSDNSSGSLWCYALDTPVGDVGTKPTITATLTTNFGWAIIAQEVSGLLPGNTTAMRDGTPGTATASSTGPCIPGALTTTAANEYLGAAAGDPGNSRTISNSAGYTASTAPNINTSATADLFLAYKNSTGAAESASFAITGTANPWFALIIAFKLAPPAGGVVQAWPGQTWLRRFHHRQQPQQFPPAAAAGAAPVPLPRTSPAQARLVPPVTGRASGRDGLFAGTGPAVRALAQAVAGKLRGLPARGRTASRAGTYQNLGPPVTPPRGPVRAVRQPPQPGGHAAGRAGTFTSTAVTSGPPVYPLHGPVRAQRVTVRGGSTASHRGAYGGLGPPVKPAEGPVRAQPAPQRGGRTASRSGTFTFVSLTSGPPVYPLHGPIEARRLPQRGGSTSSRTGVYGRTGPPVKPLSEPVKAQPPPQRGGRVTGRSGTFTAVSLTSGPPIYPLGHPAQARRQPQRGGSVTRRAGVYQGSGPQVPALKQPLGQYRKQPPPPARGRVASLRGTPQGTGPAVPPLHRPVRARLPGPFRAGRVRTTLLPPVPTPPPAFTIGALTAADKPGSVLTAAGASSALTASTALTAALTASAAPLGVLTASAAPGPGAAGLLDELATAVLDEGGAFILNEDGT